MRIYWRVCDSHGRDVREDDPIFTQLLAVHLSIALIARWRPVGFQPMNFLTVQKTIQSDSFF